MRKSPPLLSALPLLLLPLYPYAQETAQSASTEAPVNQEGGRPLRFGNVNVLPMAELRWGHDDNINQAPDTATQPAQASPIWVLNTGVTADLEHKGDRYSLQYLGAYTRYTDSSLDNINSHTMRLQGANTLDVRHGVRWEAGLVDSYDPRGSTDATVAVQAPSHYQTRRVGGTYVYGAEGAKGRIEADAFFTSKEYKNNREIMATADVDSTELNGRFFWQVMPKTSATFELRYVDYDYVAANAGLDSSGLQWLVGAEWNATAATSGRFRIGHTSRRYASRADFSGPSWEGAVTWKPLTYSTFTVTTGRTISDTTSGDTGAVGDYVLVNNHGLKWTHDWRSNLHSEVLWNYTRAEYIGVARLDKLNVYKAGLYYDFRRWMNAGIELNYSDRVSSNPLFTFDRLQSLAVVRAQF